MSRLHSRVWSRGRCRVRASHHRTIAQPRREAADVYLRHPGLRPLGGGRPLRADDGLPHPVRLLGAG